jgi:HPt (histidine-containing phosphotransfer) domain-containing protein
MSNEESLEKLRMINVDVDAAITRFINNVDMYILFLKKFPSDPAFQELQVSLSKNDFDNAFEAAHTLKGLCGNLGLTDLYVLFSDIVANYREKNYLAMEDIFIDTEIKYREICSLLTNL